MKALILNSGLGHRMGVLTSEHPKCMTEISHTETILSRQLKMLVDYGITDIVITTGYYDSVLINYCNSLSLPVHITFVRNDQYDRTNYIYSIYCARKYVENEDIILMHGDLVFENQVFERLLQNELSCMVVSSTIQLPEKDFKAVIFEKKIVKVGIEFFTDALAAQPLYKLKKNDWNIWLNKITSFCEQNERNCYAENALNEISDKIELRPLDVKSLLCSEIDTPIDLNLVSKKLFEVENKKVYMCFATDIVHSGHIEIIKKAVRLGKLTVGVLSDDAISTYKHVPALPCDERKTLFKNLSGVSEVIVQNTLSYRKSIEELRPDFVVHGDDWKTGIQKKNRDEVIELLSEYGGTLVEYPYAKDKQFVPFNYEMLNSNIQFLCISQLENVLKAQGIKKILFVHGNFVTELPVFEKIKGISIPYSEFTNFTPNPKYDEVIIGTKQYLSQKCDGILAVGGGSAIDIAKCIKISATLGLEKDFTKDILTKSEIPLIVLPTTAGTGSEATTFAVIYNNGKKISIENKNILPNAIIKEPSVLAFVPQYQRISTACDALCHAIEAWWSINSTQESVAFSKISIKFLLNSMDSYIFGDNSKIVLENMFSAAYNAGVAINIAKTTAAHALSYRLTSLYGLSHGHAVIICIPEVLKYMSANIDSCTDKRGKSYITNILKNICSEFSCNSINEFINFIEDKIKKYGLNYPKSKNRDRDIEDLVDNVNPERLNNFPFNISKSEIKQIYSKIIF